ncbi:MAG: hypothetical protein GY753_08900 [Gammaproteobacteria bacterium]|nr:hypothetical protein [Gammaproteobacteria bacterium]
MGNNQKEPAKKERKDCAEVPEQERRGTYGTHPRLPQTEQINYGKKGKRTQIKPCWPWRRP